MCPRLRRWSSRQKGQSRLTWVWFRGCQSHSGNIQTHEFQGSPQRLRSGSQVQGNDCMKWIFRTVPFAENRRFWHLFIQENRWSGGKGSCSFSKSPAAKNMTGTVLPTLLFRSILFAVLPGKNGSHLGSLTKFGQNYSIPILIKLENSIWQFYVQRPQLNWSVTRPEITRILQKADMEQAKLSAVQSKQQKPKQQLSSTPQKFNRRGFTNTGSSNNYSQSQGQGGVGWGQYTPTTDPRDTRCKNWNFKACVNNPKCFRQHACWYCYGNHKALDCNNQRW